MITFKQQFDKLTEAYIRGEVDPFKDCACFVGNLLDETNWSCLRYSWRVGKPYPSVDPHRTYLETPYTNMEIVQLEFVFMSVYSQGHFMMRELGFQEGIYKKINKVIDEDALFEAFSKTLDLLKQIHESKGEIVEPFEFVKRQSTPV